MDLALAMLKLSLEAYNETIGDIHQVRESMNENLRDGVTPLSKSYLEPRRTYLAFYASIKKPMSWLSPLEVASAARI